MNKSVRNALIAAGMIIAGLGSFAFYTKTQADCCVLDGEASPSERGAFGLMTGLPLYWPIGGSFESMLSQEASEPWQRSVLTDYGEVRLLDTLDDISELQQIAIIQPRGLSPSDNVALDDWVRSGGRLLFVLDPALTGHYDLAITDPRHPPVSALIPPVIERWGLAMTVDYSPDTAAPEHELGDRVLPVKMAGRLQSVNDSAKSCDFLASNIVAQCPVGEGRVTIIADAAVFEESALAGENGRNIASVLDFAFYD